MKAEPEPVCMEEPVEIRDMMMEEKRGVVVGKELMKKGSATCVGCGACG